MPTRFIEVVVDATDAMSVARFWSSLLGWPLQVEDGEIFMGDECMDLVFGSVPEPKIVKNRVHLDLASSSPAHQQETVDRALELGARHIDIGQGDVPWVVMADPEGNEFCVIEKTPDNVDTGAIASITMDCANPAAIAPFWSAAMGMSIDRGDEDFVALRPASGRGPWLALDRVPEPKIVKNRAHIDVAPYAADDQAAEVERLIALGAQHVDIGQGDVPWVCLVDPEGSEVCVLSPRD